MPSTELHCLELLEVGRLMQSGELSPVEATQAARSPVPIRRTRRRAWRRCAGWAFQQATDRHGRHPAM